MNTKPEIEITGITVNPIQVVLADAEDINCLTNKKNVKKLVKQLWYKAQVAAAYRMLEKAAVKYPYLYNFKLETLDEVKE